MRCGKYGPGSRAGWRGNEGRRRVELIAISAEHCNGCATCVETCPNGAIYLVDHRATVDESLCQDCGLCIAACPTGAIAGIETAVQPATERVQVAAPRPEMVIVKAEERTPALRAKVLPAVGGALAWVGREVMPRLAETLLDRWQRQALDRTGGDASRNGGSRRGGGGQRRRRRQRGRQGHGQNQAR
jgi:Fe-S-cluster-containing hydrogenase component 2